MDRIVVGTDGSASSRAALQWAVEEARRHEAELVVVTTWTRLPPPVVHPYAGFPAEPVGDPAAAARQAVEELLRSIPAAQELAATRIVAVPGHPAEVLVEQARDADLVVVGARGRGPVDWLLGSVSTQVAQHAPTTVVIVR